MTRGELLARASSSELTDWQAYESIEPFPAERTEVMLAQIAQIVANSNRDPKKRREPYPLADFLPFRDAPEPVELSPEEVSEKVLGIFGAIAAGQG